MERKSTHPAVTSPHTKAKIAKKIVRRIVIKIGQRIIKAQKVATGEN
jgi:hypothetical protein